MSAGPKPVGAELAARLAAYATLRDAGTRRNDAALELGVSYDTTLRYERWYRAQRGLPLREPHEGGWVPR